MANAEIWRTRIDEWKKSGLSAAKFCEGKDFAAHQLWCWTAKFRKASQGASLRSPAFRMARVVRVPRQEQPAADMDMPIPLEFLGVRMMIPANFNRAALTTILDVIETRKLRVASQ